MSHTTVYSPQGEMFETSSLNAHDLVTHANWSYDAPAAGASKAEPETEEPADETNEEEAGDDAADETSEDDASDEDAGDNADAPFTEEHQFDGLTTKDDVAAYLAIHFPDFKPHHLAKRESLIAKAIELATA